jgi:hypothetical protein
VKHSSIHTFLSFVAMHNYELEQLDVKTSFLYGDLEEDIYMEHSEGFIVLGKKTMCAGWRSFYMVWNNLQDWYKRFDSFMISNDFRGHSMIAVFISSLLMDHLHTCYYMLMICWLLLRVWKKSLLWWHNLAVSLIWRILVLRRKSLVWK